MVQENKIKKIIQGMSEWTSAGEADKMAQKMNRQIHLCVIVSLFFILLVSPFSWICSI